MAIKYKNPEYITLKGLKDNDPEYPEITITDKARIPVIALSYEDKDIAKEKELLIDYKKGGLYVVDAEDRTIIHDITKLIANNYLNNINGDNTFVNIEGLGLINLADILKILYESRIDLVNTIDDTISLPGGAEFDNQSITIANNKVEVYGFHRAPPLSTPRVSEDGMRIEWVGGVQTVRPGDDIDKVDEPPGGFEPPLGAKQNVLYIHPVNGVIILYNKPYQYTHITTADYQSYEIRYPKTIMQYAKFYWRLDAEDVFNIQWPSNLIWLNPKPTKSSKQRIFIFECQTWDYGNTWMIKYIDIEYYTKNIIDDLPDEYTYYTDENGDIIVDSTGTTVFTVPQDSDDVPTTIIRNTSDTPEDKINYNGEQTVYKIPK